MWHLHPDCLSPCCAAPKRLDVDKNIPHAEVCAILPGQQSVKVLRGCSGAEMSRKTRSRGLLRDARPCRTRADAPSRGRALASAGVAGKHRGSLVHQAYHDRNIRPCHAVPMKQHADGKASVADLHDEGV